MPLVRILKSLGFEQAGDIVDYRGNVEEALSKGEIELLDGDPREVVNSQTVTTEPQPQIPDATKEEITKIEQELEAVKEQVEGK